MISTIQTEPTLREILNAIEHLDHRVGSLEESNQDIIETVAAFANNTEIRLQSLENRFDTFETRFNVVEKKVTKIEATMVTKSYLDDKLADFHSDIVKKFRTEDKTLYQRVEKNFVRKQLIA